MRAALVFHFEGMTEGGVPLPAPKGLKYYVRSGEQFADLGDLLTIIPADELRANVSTASSVA